eukprot:Phypoly_transcript_06791.p1 GENE.Phypoly_transcript_06791~~Phypoly_transcript_06791.p1  ORF type:complete len:454 (+),score=54.12 Phypoly_transcript_06791:84-1445(+)
MALCLQNLLLMGGKFEEAYIFLDTPSSLSYIEHSYSAEQLYVFGGDHLRVVNTAKNFTVDDHYYAVDWHQEFISLHVFHNGTDLWAIGPTNPSDYSAHPEGYDLPVAIAGPEWHTVTIDGFKGYILYSVFVDDRNLNDVLAYMVGWIPTVNSTLNQVSFGVVRLHANINLPYASRNFTFDPKVDVLALASNQFSLYSPSYRPQVHYQNTTNTLIIVDPATSSIYTVNAGPGTSPLTAGQAQSLPMHGMYMSSSLYRPATNLLYVGYAASGWGNGSIAAVNMATFKIQYSLQFDGTLANPRAITYDESTNSMYVGCNGGDAFVKMDQYLNLQAFQRVPTYLQSMEAARVGEGHIYIITNEQHAKVARVGKEDFCSHLCPVNGYCKKGKCVCAPNLKMNSNKQTCDIPKGTSDKGAAAALGVLFALTFIAAAAGWVMWWRQRKSGYASFSDSRVS